MRPVLHFGQMQPLPEAKKAERPKFSRDLPCVHFDTFTERVGVHFPLSILASVFSTYPSFQRLLSSCPG